LHQTRQRSGHAGLDELLTFCSVVVQIRAGNRWIFGVIAGPDLTRIGKCAAHCEVCGFAIQGDYLQTVGALRLVAGPDADRADTKRFLAAAANDFDLIAHGPTMTRRLLKPRKIKAFFILADHSRRFGLSIPTRTVVRLVP
jgi:hypothetical protein